MSVSERFNLFWIARALTISCQYEQERYYYDTIHHNLFSIINFPSESIVLDKYNTRYDIITEADITVRMNLTDDYCNSIIEIPRLSVTDKKEIQFGFLSLMEDKLHHDKCLLAVSEQDDQDGFVLDALFHRRHILTPYWETLKLQLSFGFMSKLSQNLARINYLNN